MSDRSPWLSRRTLLTGVGAAALAGCGKPKAERSAPAVAVVTIQRLTIPVPPVVVPPLRPPSRPPVIPPGPRRNKRSKPK